MPSHAFTSRHGGGLHLPDERPIAWHRAIGQRATYDQRPGTADAFIVPVLRDAIERAIAECGASSPAGSRVLDLGCGRQPFRALLERQGYHYTSCDVMQNADGTVDHLCAIDGVLPPSLTSLGPFELLLCTEVLEHVADWTSAFAHVAALAAPGGRVIFTCPHVYPLHEEPYDFWRPTPYALYHFAAAHGFIVDRFEPAGDGWDVLGTVLGSLRVTGRPGIVGRIARLGACAVKRLVLEALRRGTVRAWVGAGGPWYLSNVAILRRCQSDPAGGSR